MNKQCSGHHGNHLYQSPGISQPEHISSGFIQWNSSARSLRTSTRCWNRPRSCRRCFWECLSRVNWPWFSLAVFLPNGVWCIFVRWPTAMASASLKPWKPCPLVTLGMMQSFGQSTPTWEAPNFCVCLQTLRLGFSTSKLVCAMKNSTGNP